MGGAAFDGDVQQEDDNATADKAWGGGGGRVGRVGVGVGGGWKRGSHVCISLCVCCCVLVHISMCVLARGWAMSDCMCVSVCVRLRTAMPQLTKLGDRCGVDGMNAGEGICCVRVCDVRGCVYVCACATLHVHVNVHVHVLLCLCVCVRACKRGAGTCNIGSFALGPHTSLCPCSLCSVPCFPQLSSYPLLLPTCLLS